MIFNYFFFLVCKIIATFAQETAQDDKVVLSYKQLTFHTHFHNSLIYRKLYEMVGIGNTSFPHAVIYH